MIKHKCSICQSIFECEDILTTPEERVCDDCILEEDDWWDEDYACENYCCACCGCSCSWEDFEPSEEEE